MKFDIDNLDFRPLRADEIELRVGTVSGKGGAILLLYQDARCAMDVLDETVGKSNWQREVMEVKGNLYCGIGIWDEQKSQWIWKYDCGVESATEAIKGESSDAFKRASVNWGIGRELYSAPHIYVPCQVKKKDKGYGYELANRYEFSNAYVSHIAYNTKREISELIIKDDERGELYSYPKKGKHTQQRQQPIQPQIQRPPQPNDYKPSDMITAEEASALRAELRATNSDEGGFLAYVSHFTKMPVMAVEEMTKQQWVFAMKEIERKKGERN